MGAVRRKEREAHGHADKKEGDWAEKKAEGSSEALALVYCSIKGKNLEEGKQLLWEIFI